MDSSGFQASVTLLKLHWVVSLHLHRLVVMHWSSADSSLPGPPCKEFGVILDQAVEGEAETKQHYLPEFWEAQCSSFFSAFSYTASARLSLPIPSEFLCCLCFFSWLCHKKRRLKHVTFPLTQSDPFFFFFLQQHFWRGATYVSPWWVNMHRVLSARYKLNTV